MAQIYAICGGKGGGKSFLTANFGALFARQGINTVKAIYLRRVKQILKHYAFNNIVKELSREPEAGLVRSPWILLI